MAVAADTLDFDFKYEIAREPGGEHILRCFACGTCSAGCPVHAVEAKYNPRRIIRKILLGMKDDVLNSDFIWLCSTCYSCQERCPQDVRIADLMTSVKNYAARHGKAPASYLQQLDLIKKFGRLYEIDEFDNKKREKMGLPSLPFTCEEVETLLHLLSGGQEEEG
ncbi:MAG: 4Fe-4S dicluster domain-containing protein [Candidatus Hydrogenedentota bacterium]|nr:MAG: 4Fe-4S dicluster domain-containing protein [Candidatus Hydrogenedentota bacterium]